MEQVNDERKKEREGFMDLIRSLSEDVNFWKELCKEKTEIITEYHSYIRILKQELSKYKDE